MIGLLISFAVGAGVGYAVGRAHMHIIVEALKTDVAGLWHRVHNMGVGATANSKPTPSPTPTPRVR